MKKFILPVIFAISFLLFLPQKTYSQTGPECMNIFDKEMKDCTTEYNACSDACMKEGEKPDGTAYFNAGEIYPKCMKASQCHEKSSSCSEQALINYRACGKPDKQSESAEAKKEAPVQDKKGVNIFKIFELFSKAVTNLATNKENSDPSQKETQPAVEELSANTKFGVQQIAQVNDWIMENNLITDPARLEQMEREKLDLELYGRTPQMTDEIVKKAQSEWEAMFTKTNEESIAVINGRGQFTTPEGFIVLGPHDKPLKVTFIDDTFINPNSETTQLNYTWGTSSGAVVSMPAQAEVKFLKPVQDEKTQQLKRMLKLNKGEVEIKVKNDNKKDKFGVQGDFFDLFVIQTHFWVNQSQDKNLAVIGVYEGEVEVETRNGKTIKIKPDGNRPGVVVVTQKLSPVKLAVVGLVLVIAVGGIVWFVKRKKKR